MAFEDVYAEVLSSSSVAGYYDEGGTEFVSPLEKLLPPGVAWVFADDSEMIAFLTGLSYSFWRAFNRGQDLLEEFDPRTTFELLTDWERVLGLPGDNPSPATTLAERRAAVHARLLGFGDPNEQSFEDIAASLGFAPVNLIIRKHTPFVPGSVAGDPVAGDDWVFQWWVEVDPADGDTEALLWEIQQTAPAHTQVGVKVLFGYETEELTNPKNFDINAIAWSHDLALFCAVGEADGTDAYLATSADGITWTERANPKNFDLEGVTWAPALGLFVAVGAADGTDAYLITSPDGITWTERANPKNVTLYAVEWSDPLGLLVAVGSIDGATDAYIATSPDGITWTERSNPKNTALITVAWSKPLGLFCAAGVLDGADAYMVTSPDGITWTERSNPSNVTLRSMVWATGLGLFVAVGDASGGDAYTITSPDGTTWTERTNAVNSQLNAVVWNDAEERLLAAGADDGTDAALVSSADGITWTEHTNPKAFDIYALANAQSFSMFGTIIAGGEADGTDAYMLSLPGVS